MSIGKLPRVTAVQMGLLAVAGFFGGFGGWAALAPLDGAVVGTGALAVHGNSKTVQHKEGGIVAALLVADGDRVAADQVLIRLDDTQVTSMLRVHQAQLLGDEALCARDLAEIGGAASVAFPPDLREDDAVSRSVMARERIVFDNHRGLLAQQLRVIDERIAQARRQQAGAVAQHEAAMRGLAFGTQQLACAEHAGTHGPGRAHHGAGAVTVCRKPARGDRPAAVRRGAPRGRGIRAGSRETAPARGCRWRCHA